MTNLTYVIALMFVLVAMQKVGRSGACIQCGKRLRHAHDCPSQKGR